MHVLTRARSPVFTPLCVYLCRPSIDAFKELAPADQRKALREHFLGGQGSAELIRGMDKADRSAMLAHLTGLLTRPAVADCLAPLLETIDSDTMSHLLTNLLSNPHVPRPMIGSLLGQVYNRTENADKPLIVSGMMKHLDGASVE